MTRILFAGRDDMWPEYQVALGKAAEELGLTVEITTTPDDPPYFDYVVYAPNSGLEDFTPFTGLKAVLSLWAGVETFEGNPTLKAPLARMVDFGLTEGMAEWVLGHLMRLHLGMDAHIKGQDGNWRNGDFLPKLARDVTVGVLGLGELGQASAQLLTAAGFNVCGWSRRLKTIKGVDCQAGQDGLDAVVAKSDYLVLLLPQTNATENLLDADLITKMPKGAAVLNPGRGPLIDDPALIDALNSGHLSHAVLDVFRVEPLPRDHPYWAMENVTVTPHIASETRPSSAARSIMENVRRGEAGEPLLHLVDRKAGY